MLHIERDINRITIVSTIKKKLNYIQNKPQVMN